MAAGSHTTYAGWEPRHCIICRQPIVKSRDGELEQHGHRFHLNDYTGQAMSWHVTCERKQGWPHTKEAP